VPTSLSTALVTLGLLALPVQDPPPSAERVAATVEALREAFSNGEAPERIEALGEASSVPDAEVCKWVAKGLADKDHRVQLAAIESLRRLDHPAAVEALQSGYEHRKELREDEDLGAALLKAVGQHGSPDSIEFLADDLFGSKERAAIRARILGLGNIRDVRAVEELMGLMKKASRRNVQPYMADLRLALLHLTGHDEGRSIDLWMTWWTEHKRGFELPETPPKLPRMDQLAWDYYWGNEIVRERPQKRGERGDDDAPRGAAADR